MPGIVYFGSKSISGAGEEEFFGTLSDSIILRNLTQQAAMINDVCTGVITNWENLETRVFLKPYISENIKLQHICSIAI
jgi:hypothetical protein